MSSKELLWSNVCLVFDGQLALVEDVVREGRPVDPFEVSIVP